MKTLPRWISVRVNDFAEHVSNIDTYVWALGTDCGLDRWLDSPRRDDVKYLARWFRHVRSNLRDPSLAPVLNQALRQAVADRLALVRSRRYAP